MSQTLDASIFLNMLPEYPGLDRKLSFQNFSDMSEITVSYIITVKTDLGKNCYTTKTYPFKEITYVLEDFLDPDFVRSHAELVVGDDVNTLKKVIHGIK